MNTRSPLFSLGLAELAAFLLLVIPAVSEAEAEKARPFDLNQVQLLEGPFKHAQELERNFLLATDVDKLLYPFRREAKLPNPAKGMDALGWEVTGHFLGHYLSACALMYRNTGDEELKRRADAAVAALAECQAALGTGFLGGFPERSILVLQKKLEDPAADASVPWYCLHKVYAGLLDMHTLAGNRQALEVLEKAVAWAETNTNALTEAEMQRMLEIEHGGMNELLANLYAVTGKEAHLKLSLRFNHKAVTEPAANDRDQLDGLHANTTIPKFTGLAVQHQLTGDPALAKAAGFFWKVVTEERSYVTGGNSAFESFSPKTNLSAYVHQKTTESCNSYNMLKLTRALFQIAPSAAHGDYYERTLINHVLSSQHPVTGGQLYYQELETGSGKGLWGTVNTSSVGRHYSCCQGTGLESHSKVADSIYFHDGKKALYINLFIASALDWKENGLRLQQQTRFPDEGSSRFSFTCEKPVGLSVRLRRPHWATEGFALLLNGQPLATDSVPGSFIQVNRTWASGDTLEVKMPMSLRLEAFKDDPRRAALLLGPVVLAAVTEPGNPFAAIVSHDLSTVTQALQPVPGKPLEFTASPAICRTTLGSIQSEPVLFKPLFRMVDESYAVYWDHFTEAEFEKLPAVFEPEIARQKELEPRTVDLLLFGVTPGLFNPGRESGAGSLQGILLRNGRLPRPLKEVSENAHGLKSSQGGGIHRSYPRLSRYPGDLRYLAREVRGSVSYRMRVVPDQPQQLQIRLWHARFNDQGRLAQGQKLEVLVGDQVLGKADLAKEPVDQFVDLRFSIPKELLAGKEQVAVTLRSTGSPLRGLYESRVLKE